MSLKSRILRISLVLLFLLVFVGYFAFQTFLFPPLEGEFEKDIASLIPRDVDFFVSKAEIGDLFDEFPGLAIQEKLEKNDAWETWINSPEYKDFAREAGIDQALTQIRDLQDQIPLGMDLPTIFGGEDLALVGWFNGKDMAQADWAIYGRANWAGKLGVSALKYPGLLKLEAQGLQATHEEDHVQLSGGQLPRTLHLIRIRDVIVCTTKAEVIDQALDLQVRGGKDSFFQSALYYDQIYNHPARSAEKDDIEVFVDMRAYLEATQTSGRWPDGKSQDVMPRLLARYFQANSIKQITGLIEVDEGLSVDLHGEFSSELITPLQNRFYRGRGFDRKQLQDVARFVPEDSALFIYLAGNIGDLLTQVYESLETEMQTLINDAIANSDKYDGMSQVLNDLGSSLKNRLALIVRKNDYPKDPNGPPHNDDVVPAITLIAWMENEGKIIQLRDEVGELGEKAGLKGRKPGEGGYFAHSMAGFATREFWNEMVPGTGVIATMNANDAFVISNAYQMLEHLAKTAFARERRALDERSDFLALSQSSLAKGNVLIWSDPSALSSVLREQGTRWAEENIPEPDWVTIRKKLENEVTAELYPGTARAALDETQEAAMESEVLKRINKIERDRFQEYYPQLMAKTERNLAYLEASTAVLTMLSLNPKHFDLSMRVVAPLEK